jgi:6-methylsalicylate decarboxylase
MTSPDRIDVHQHVLPPRYAGWLREHGIRPGGIDLPDWSPPAALEFMDGHGIATGVLSVSTPGVHLGNDTEARKWAREVNEYTAGLVRADPGRFGLFATLTLPDVEGAIAEAGYALDTLHADGVILLASNAGRYLGDPGFAPLLAYLHHRQATVFVHPGELPGDPVPGIPSFTADFLLDTTRTAISLILSGAMTKYDRIKFILAHAKPSTGPTPGNSSRARLTPPGLQPPHVRGKGLVRQSPACDWRGFAVCGCLAARGPGGTDPGWLFRVDSL